MWKCPECGSDRLEVLVEVWAELVQKDDGEFETDTSTPDNGSQYWSANSCMKCNECGHSAISEEFEVTV